MTLTVLSIILDALLVILILFTAFVGLKKGFVKKFMGMTGAFAALILTICLATPAANLVYDNIVYAPIYNKVNGNLTEQFGKSGEIVVGENTAKFLSYIGVDINERVAAVTGETEARIAAVSEAVARPIATILSYVIGVVALFIVFLLLIKAITALLDALMKLPGLNALNKGLGFLLGLLCGLIYANIIGFAAYRLLPMITGGIDIIERAPITSFFGKYNIFNYLLEKILSIMLK